MKSRTPLTSALVILVVVNLVLLTACGGGGTTSTDRSGNPLPTITVISPTSAVAGSKADVALTVNGTNFISASVVNFAGAARTTAFVSSTQLTAAIPAAAFASAGTAAVTVTNPAPGGGTSNAVPFTIVNPAPINPTPTITSVSPISAIIGGAAFTLTVNGTNFISSSTVTFNGNVRVTTFISTTQLTAAIQASDIANVGTFEVTVINPAPGGGISNASVFAVQTSNPTPHIVALDPSGAAAGGPAFTLRVGGYGFTANSVLRWNGNDRPTTILGADTLTAQIPASDIVATGTATVSVFNPSPGGGSSNSLDFTIATGGVSPQSVAVDPTGKFAYVTNSVSNDISMYTINTAIGTLTLNGRIAAGANPVSMAVHPSGKFLYVANNTEAFVNNVSMYTIDPNTGTLTLIAPPVLAYTCSQSIASDPLGRFVYVASTACEDDIGSVVTYTVNATNGILTPTSEVFYDIGLYPSSIAVHPSGKFAYVANFAYQTFTPTPIEIFSIDSHGLTLIGTAAAGVNSTSVTVAPSGKFAYAANAGDNDLSTYTIDSTNGTLTPNGTIAAGAGPTSVAVDPTSKFAYAVNAGSNNISMYTIDATTGLLTSIGTVNAGVAPSSITILPSSNFAYVTNSGSNDVSIYSIDTSTGALTLIGTVGT